ncbi:MAG: flagellar hook-length control protein FliK [Gemmatimonadales bacterium]
MSTGSGDAAECVDAPATEGEAPTIVAVDATAVELPETSHVDPGALVPVTDGVVAEPLAPQGKEAQAPAKAPVAKTPCEPHRPVLLPERLLREMTPFKGTVPVERHGAKPSRLAPVLPQQTLPVERPASDAAPRAEPADEIIQVVAQAVETALPEKQASGADRPKREKAAPEQEQSGKTSASADQDQPLPPPSLMSVVQAVIELARPVITARSQGEPKGENEANQDAPKQAPTEVLPQASAAPTEGLEEWSMAGNARLATQIADLMEGLNVTEFRVELGKRVAGGAKTATSPEGMTPELAGDATPAMPVLRPSPLAGKAAAPALPPVLQGNSQAKPETPSQGTISPDKPLMPASQLLGATIINRPAGKPAVVAERDAALTISQAVDDDLVETPSPSPSIRQATTPVINAERGARNAERPADQLPLPRGANRQSPAPTIPVSRQDLPSAEPAATGSTPPETERPAPRRERPSDSAAQGSGAMSAPVERSATRGDEPATRGAREARNLPQADPDVARPAGSADRVTLQVSDGDGRATRIRVSVIGDQVRAVITPPDAESARQLEHRMDELQSALARQGFTASSVQVQTAELRPGGDALAGAGLAVSSSEARTTPGREQPAGDQRQGRGQRDQQSAGGQERQQQQGRSRDRDAQQRRR